MSRSRIFLGRLVWPLIALIMIVGAAWLLRYPLLRATGNFLISSDTPLACNAIYVLGGASIDRGLAAKEALDQGWAMDAYCLGENVPQILLGEGLDIQEGRLTANVMLRAGADAAQVHVLAKGTSTWEESVAILDHALELGFDTIMVITTDFHTRRVSMVFREMFKKQEITVLVTGAPASLYDNQRWWEKEEGLLMVNNEYVKLMYYLLKY